MAKLKLLKQNHLSTRYALEDKVTKHYPAEINALKQRIHGLIQDQTTAKQHLPTEEKGFSPMEIDHVSYTSKVEAGTALLARCKEMKMNESSIIGTYRGFAMSIAFDVFHQEYRLTLKGALSHEITLGIDEIGNITRIEHALDGLSMKQFAARQLYENTQSQLESAKEEIKRPFPQEKELQEKSKRLDTLNILLNMDHQQPDAVDATQPSEERPTKNRNEHER